MSLKILPFFSFFQVKEITETSKPNTTYRNMSKWDKLLISYPLTRDTCLQYNPKQRRKIFLITKHSFTVASPIENFPGI